MNAGLMDFIGVCLIVVGVIAEVAAVIGISGAGKRVKEWTAKIDGANTSTMGDLSDVLKALIAKLPWIAIMALLTIVLGMVLLMRRWPWQTPI